MKIICWLCIIICFALSSCSHKLSPSTPSSSTSSSASPSKPVLEKTDFKLDSLPDSEIDIPIRISLHPFYTMAEKNIDTVYTSPNYPKDWVQADCATRYKYHFRRGPLQMRVAGNVMSLGFMGYYQVVGSTRACVSGAVISPWTPACNCGFNEGERRVNVSFSNSVVITPDYKVKLTVKRLEPEPLDKCTVCFWGQDITKEVMTGLKANLDEAKAAIEKKYGTVDLRTRFQSLWDRLNQPYNFYQSGWLQINPKKIRLNNIMARNDSLNLNLGLSVHPVIGLEKSTSSNSAIPAISDFNNHTGFNIFLDAMLDYDSLSTIVNAQLKGKQFDFKKGPVDKSVTIRSCKLLGVDNEKLVIKVDFEGSYNGAAWFTGKPYYDDKDKTIEMRDVDFDIKTRDALLRTASWLFNKRITAELKRYSRFDLSTYIDSAKLTLNQQINKEWIKGIKSSGQITDIQLIGIYPVAKHLVIRSNCSGDLSILVESINL
ncbi:MAG: DUF4403 family protein [Chitinophagaceae bacterium]